MIAFSLESLDRSIYENIRLELVKRGLSPDITDNTIDYRAEASKIADFVILKGEGSAESKDLKESNSITIDRMKISPDSTGGNSIGYIKKENGNFTKYKYPATTVTVMYDIRVISSSARMERLLISLIYKVLGLNKYIPMIAEGGTDFDRSANLVNDMATDMGGSEFMEYMFKYYFSDIWLLEAIEVEAEEIPALRDITSKVDLETQNGTKTSVGGI